MVKEHFDLLRDYFIVTKRRGARWAWEIERHSTPIISRARRRNALANRPSTSFWWASSRTARTERAGFRRASSA
jgi:hypothetical protein